MKPPDSDPLGDSIEPAERTELEATLAYHQRTKHLPSRFAASLGYLDWATQPDPFLRFDGAETFPLALQPIGPLPAYEPAFLLGNGNAAALDAGSVSRLFQDSLALSAWKEVPGSRWPLRVNPSSGNLHPTEGYLVSGPVAGLHDRAGVYHYAPRAHALELRVELSEERWRAIAAQLPDDALLIGLSSICWRESWKYGEAGHRRRGRGHGEARAAQRRLLVTVVVLQ